MLAQNCVQGDISDGGGGGVRKRWVCKVELRRRIWIKEFRKQVAPLFCSPWVSYGGVTGGVTAGVTGGVTAGVTGGVTLICSIVSLLF